MGISVLTAARIRKGQKEGKTGEEGFLVMDRLPNIGLLKVRKGVSKVSKGLLKVIKGVLKVMKGVLKVITGVLMVMKGQKR